MAVLCHFNNPSRSLQIHLWQVISSFTHSSSPPEAFTEQSGKQELLATFNFFYFFFFNGIDGNIPSAKSNAGKSIVLYF